MFRSAQHTTEYAILLALAVAIVAGMQTYVKRSLNAKVKKGTDAFIGAGSGVELGFEGLDGSFYSEDMESQSQYEPYYAYSQSTAYTEFVKQQHTGRGQFQQETVSQLTVQLPGSTRSEFTVNPLPDPAEPDPWADVDIPDYITDVVDMMCYLFCVIGVPSDEMKSVIDREVGFVIDGVTWSSYYASYSAIPSSGRCEDWD